MFGRNVVFEIGSEYAAEHHISYNIFSRKIKSYIHSLEGVYSTKFNLKNKYKYSILLTGEEINVVNFKLPNTRKAHLDSLVENELYFHTRRKGNLLFNYIVLRKDKKCLEVLVFYLNTNKLDFLDKYSSGSIKSRGVFLVQLSVLSSLIGRIKVKNYMLVFSYKERCYCIYCIDNRVFDCCSFFKSELLRDSVSQLANFIEKNKIYSSIDIQVIYTYNMGELNVEETVPKAYKFEDLGSDRKNNIIRSVLRKGN